MRASSLNPKPFCSSFLCSIKHVEPLNYHKLSDDFRGNKSS